MLVSVRVSEETCIGIGRGCNPTSMQQQLALTGIILATPTEDEKHYFFTSILLSVKKFHLCVNFTQIKRAKISV